MKKGELLVSDPQCGGPELGSPESQLPMSEVQASDPNAAVLNAALNLFTSCRFSCSSALGAEFHTVECCKPDNYKLSIA